jgi:hypothetical protein
MTAIIIVIVVGLIIYFGTKKKTQQTLADNRSLTNNSTSKIESNPTRQKFQSKISAIPFPDRINAIVWHIKAIDKALENGDLNLANLSYAKLIESIRQQNVNENGSFDDHLQAIRKEYEEFRSLYGLEYPQQFLPPSQRQKTKSATTTQNNPITKITSNNSKLKTLISELASKGHPEYPLLRKEYAVTSNMPYRDFSDWVIEQLKLKDFNSLFAFVKEFYLDRDDNIGEQALKKNFEKFLTKDFKSLFNDIDEQAIFEIQAFFILKHGIDDFNREFWISEDKEAELLCKILSVYSFSINQNSFDPLVKKANKFLREMKKDNDYWEDFKNYKVEELKIENKLEVTTDFITKLKRLSPGERLHFFDFATIYSYRKYWNGDSSYKTRCYGINEIESIDKISTLGIFETVNDIEAVPEIASKGELKESAETAGFEVKKSWTMAKIFENLMKTENGQLFLKEFVKNRKILAFKEEFKADLNKTLNYQTSIRRAIDLITMM